MEKRASFSKRALFDLLHYAPHPGQVLVHKSRARFRVLACGTRWGKSLSAAMEIVVALLAPSERTLGWAVAPTYELTKRVVDHVRRVLYEYFKHRIVEDDQREQRIVVRNLAGGLSELRGKTADNPVSLLGEALDFLVIDEASKLPAKIWSSYLSQRLIDRRGWALLISTPNGINWFHGCYWRGQEGRDPEWESWRSPTWANPYMDAETIAQEKKQQAPPVFDQEYGAVFLGEERIPCETCGGPSERLQCTLIWDEGVPIPTCPACGLDVDREGNSIVHFMPDGSLRRYLIIIAKRHEGPPPPLPGEGSPSS
jgi:hypothetical protein